MATFAMVRLRSGKDCPTKILFSLEESISMATFAMRPFTVRKRLPHENHLFPSGAQLAWQRLKRLHRWFPVEIT
jgi:hypothetical protein